MPPRTFATSSKHVLSVPPIHHACRCTCGSIFTNPIISLIRSNDGAAIHTQRRLYAQAMLNRPSKVTKGRILAPSQLRKSYDEQLWYNLSALITPKLYQWKAFSCSYQQVKLFMKMFCAIMVRTDLMNAGYIKPRVFEILLTLVCTKPELSKRMRLSVGDDVDNIVALSNAENVSDLLPVGSDLREKALLNASALVYPSLATTKMSRSTSTKLTQEAREFGVVLLRSLSAAGLEEATIMIMNQVYVQQRKQRAQSKGADLPRERATLQKIAAKGTNVKALVLEGKFRQKTGDELGALKLFRAALPLATEYDKVRRKLPKWKLPFDEHHLTSPWVEMFYLRADRTQRGLDEREFAEEAVIYGCHRDDPDMWYQYAASFSMTWTSGWLYGMSKAAASSNPKAMHQLALWYCNCSWPYIEDEPPDDLKPTAFDSYPAKDPNGGLLSKGFHALLSLGRSKSNRVEDEQNMDLSPQTAEVFKAYAWPHVAEQRLALGYEWALLATASGYAPAYHTLAQLHAQPYISASLDAPDEAIDMTNDRYSFSTKVEHDEAIESGYMKRGTAPFGGFGIPNLHEQGDVPDKESGSIPEGCKRNPYYSLEKAYRYTQFVFHAIEAIDIYKNARFNFTKSDDLRDRWATMEEASRTLDVAQFIPAEVPASWRSWLSSKNSIDSWEQETKKLDEEATNFVARHRWNVRDGFGDIMIEPGYRRRKLFTSNGILALDLEGEQAQLIKSLSQSALNPSMLKNR